MKTLVLQDSCLERAFHTMPVKTFCSEVEYFERTVRDDLAIGVQYPRPRVQFNSAESAARRMLRKILVLVT